MRKFRDLQGKFVYFTALKITDETNKMFKIMGEAFGEKFMSTDKKLPEDFFKVMFDTMSKSIEDSRIHIEAEMTGMVSRASDSSNVISISELSHNEVKIKEIKAVYESPRFPELPKDIDRKYWEEYLDKFTWSVRGESTILIETMPFDEGRVSFVFKIKDLSRGLHMVGKIDKKIFI